MYLLAKYYRNFSSACLVFLPEIWLGLGQSDAACRTLPSHSDNFPQHRKRDRASKVAIAPISSSSVKIIIADLALLAAWSTRGLWLCCTVGQSWRLQLFPAESGAVVHRVASFCCIVTFSATGDHTCILISLLSLLLRTMCKEQLASYVTTQRLEQKNDSGCFYVHALKTN